MLGLTLTPVSTLINLAILGKWDDTDYLEAIGLVSMFVGLSLEAIGLSLTSCLETLVSQAYGASDFELCRVYLNRQFLINTVVFIILAMPLSFSEEIFSGVLS